jgi:hypothetical protein
MKLQMKRTRPVLWVLLSLFLFLGVTRTAQAQELIFGDAVPAGETVERDIFLTGDTVRLEGTVDGDVLAIGTSVVLEGTVTGSLVAIGGDVIISGEVGGSVYAIAGTLDLIGDAEIGHSLHSISAFLGLREGAEIGRDLIGISLSANLGGSIGRDTRMVIGLLEIGRIILESINAATTGKPLDELFLDSNQYAGAAPIGGALFSLQLQEEEDEAEEEEPAENPTLAWLAEQAQRLVSYLIVGLLLLWLRPAWLQEWAATLRRRPLPSAGIGLVVYIIGFIVFVFLLIIFLVLAIGLVLLSLWELGLIIGGIALTATGLAFYTFLLFVAFISKIIVAFLVGTLILERVYPRGNEFRLWPFLLGLLLYLIICAIPVLGWVAALVATFFGLGAAWTNLTSRRQVLAETAAPAG